MIVKDYFYILRISIYTVYSIYSIDETDRNSTNRNSYWAIVTKDDNDTCLMTIFEDDLGELVLWKTYRGSSLTWSKLRELGYLNKTQK